MTRRIVQRAIIKVVQPQIVEYICDECGKVCGTRANPKETWTGMGRKAGEKSHYCKKTCGPHAIPRREAILGALAADHTRKAAGDLMPLPNMTPAQLLAGAREVSERFPDAELVKNSVGNLAIMTGGVFAGYLDLRTGEAVFDPPAARES